MIRFNHINKNYQLGMIDVPALKGATGNIRKGEMLALCGPSGSGKSTLLNILGLLDTDYSGEIEFGGEPMPKEPQEAACIRRFEMGFIFQRFNLVPVMTALENVMLGVEQVFPHGSKEERHDICAYYLTKVGLGDSLHKKAADMSNGMRQRVGIARAFALKPKLLLFDEPFGMLDSMTKKELQDVLIDVWNTEKITAIVVTHDVDEALYLSDRVIMMTSGPRAQVGDILSVHIDRPRDRKAFMSHPDYYKLRGHLIDFLEKGG